MELRGFPGGSEVKASACNAGDLGSIPGSGRYPGEGNGNPLQYSCLENPWTEEPSGLHTVHRVAKSRTQLSELTFTYTTSPILKKPCINKIHDGETIYSVYKKSHKW